MEDLYKKYYKSVRGFTRRKIDDEGVVEELTNDIMLAGIKSWPSFNHKCSEFSFLCSIANHKIIDYYRKKKIKTILFSASPIFEEIADEALSPEKNYLKNELKREMKKTLKELREGYGNVLRLKYMQGLKVREIAKILKISIKAVESRLIRAKSKFAESWNYDRKKNTKALEVVGAGRD